MTETRAVMGTLVTMTSVDEAPGIHDAMARAFTWFDEVEARCSRFEPESELRRLCGTVDQDVALSPMLFEALQTAVAVAEASGGAFDPAVGARMEAAGYDRHYRSGQRAPSGVAPAAEVSFRDLHLDARRQTARLARPLLLDLGAVAKGMAVDLAARELAPFRNFVIDAGGDLYCAGRNPAGEKWQIGIRHLLQPEAIMESVPVSDAAVCTSGTYERGQHILDPREGSGGRAAQACSASIIAASAMAADALATAAMVLGPRAGLQLLEREGVAGMILSTDLQRFTTANWPRSV